jgi:1-deoxy-D-xylulose-5-phosphate reductoisomerase
VPTLLGRPDFLHIPKLIDKVCDKHQVDNNQNPSLDDILAADRWARDLVIELSQQVVATNFLA